MKIDNQNMLNGISTYQNDPLTRKNDATGQQDKVRAQTGDRVELSNRSTEIEKLKKTVEAMLDVQSEKVAALKQRISEGNYKVEGAAVAEKMLEQCKGFKDSGGTK